MLTITKKLDMSPHGVPQVIRVSQYDSDFTLEFKLFASGGNFAISTGTTAEIRGTKQSGTGYSASATLDTSTKVVTVAGAAQMTAVAGMNIFEIVLKKNNKEISSANFCLLVEKAALDADTITDESVLKELNAIIESANTATQAAEEAEAAADQAEAAAQTLVIDPTLTLPGQPADAKATGDALTEIRDDLSHISGLSDDAKTALLACFEHVAWVDEHGQDYYDALESALYADQYPKITATFNSGTNTIYTDDDISSLKQYLTVKYFADRSSAGQTISANDYTLTGTLTEGTSTIFVAYNNLTTVFTVGGVVDFYNKWNWSLAEGDLTIYKGTPAFLSGSSTDGILFNNDTNSQKTRRSAYVNRGKLQCAETVSIPDDLYPIPIPSDAVKATVSINPSTMQVLLQRWKLQGNVYKLEGMNSWGSSPSVLTFTASEDAFLCVNIRYNSSNAEFASEPQGLTLTFE